MDLLFKLLLLPLAQGLIMYYMKRFRAKVQKGDIVGVEVGNDLVVNRTVYFRLEHSILALDASARVYREYHMSRVFTRDYKSLTDISADLQQLD
jgi:hypothetical protein